MKLTSILALLLLAIPGSTQEKRIYKVLKIDIVGEINDLSAAKFILELDTADRIKTDVVLVEINSPGGDVDAGEKMVRAIEKSSAIVYCIADGEAASMAFTILQSCDIRATTTRTILMIHQPSFGPTGGGNQNQFQDWADRLNASNEAMLYQISAKLKISVDILRAKIAIRPWWLNWQEALKIGAVDCISPSIKSTYWLLKTNGLTNSCIN